MVDLICTRPCMPAGARKVVADAVPQLAGFPGTPCQHAAVLQNRCRVQAACRQGADITAGKHVQLCWLNHQWSLAVAALSLCIATPAGHWVRLVLMHKVCRWRASKSREQEGQSTFSCLTSNMPDSITNLASRIQGSKHDGQKLFMAEGFTPGDNR